MENLTFTSMNIRVPRTSDFPSEFKKGFFRSLDRSFLRIFAVCFLVVVPLFIVGALQDPPKEASDEEIQQIQERYARLVMKQELPKKEIKKVDDAAAKAAAAAEAAKKAEEEKKKEEARKEETVQEKKARKEETSQQRAAKRESYKKQIENVGLFAELTASSGGGRTGRQAQDLIGDLDASANLSGLSVGSGSFVQRKSEDVGAALERRGERTEGGSIGSSEIRSASTKTLKSEGSVALDHVENVQGEAASDASRDMRSLTSVLKKYEPRLKKVYEEHLKRNPDLAGKIVMKFTIEADGTVSNVVVVSSDFKDRELERDLIRYVERIKFQPASGKVTIEWPLIFSAT